MKRGFFYWANFWEKKICRPNWNGILKKELKNKLIFSQILSYAYGLHLSQKSYNFRNLMKIQEQ